jgi:hypothetical protein
MSTFMNRHTHMNCRSCNTTTPLKLVESYGDGSIGFLCSSCERDGGVSHQCQYGSLLSAPDWLPLLVAGVGIVCPTCKRVYALGVRIEPTYPDAGQALKVLGLGLGIMILIGVVGDALQGKKRRGR